MSDKSPEVQLAEIRKVVEGHEKEVNHYYAMDLPDAIKSLLRLYEYTATDSLAAVKQFRDDVLTWLRALAMIVEMVGNAGTHAEKAARLRGMSEMIETIVAKLRDQEFDFNSQRYHWPNLFRSEYPVRRYLSRAHEAEARHQQLAKVVKRYEIALSLLRDDQRVPIETALVDAEKKLEGEKDFDPKPWALEL